MKHPIISSIGLAILATVSLITSASAGMPLWTYSTYFDNTLDDSLSAPYVGSMTFSFQASAPLADGDYALSSLFHPTLEATFYNGQTFTLLDLMSPIENVNVYLSGSSFVFTSNAAALDAVGSADFTNINGYYLTTEPLFNDGSSPSRGEIHSALYMTEGEGGSNLYAGNYGSFSPIPEVTSSFTLLGLVSSGLLLRRRTKALR